MTADLSDDLLQIDAASKTAIIDAELHQLDIDIEALQETSLADNGSLTEKALHILLAGTEIGRQT